MLLRQLKIRVINLQLLAIIDSKIEVEQVTLFVPLSPCVQVVSTTVKDHVAGHVIFRCALSLDFLSKVIFQNP